MFHKHMNILPVSLSLALACSLSFALTAPTVGAAEAKSLFEDKGVANAIGKLTEKMKAPVRVLVIEIKPTILTLQVQDPAAPTHINEYKYARRPGVLALLGDAAVSGPEPVKLSLINPRLEENLFTLTDVNFAAVPETIREALKRVKVEGGVVEGITIRKQLLLNQSGPVEWSIYVRSPRESATAYADAAGKIHRLDLRGTTRAETLDLLQGGEMLNEAIAQIREQFGASPVFTSFSISTKSVSFKMRNPKDRADVVGHYWDINGIHQSTDIMLPGIRKKMGQGVRDEQLFSINDVDWSRLPALRPIALEKAAVPGGRIQGIDLGRPETVGEAKPVRWNFTVAAGLLGQNTSVEFDAKSGALTRAISPKSRETVGNYFEPEAARRAIPVIGKELSRAVGYVDLTFSKENVSIKAPTREKPELIRQFFYKENEEVVEFGVPMPGNPLYKDFTKAWLFTLADLEPALPRLEELQRKTLERLGLSEGAVERMTFFRHSVFYPKNKKVLLEIRAANSKGEDGRVVYDLDGREIDVVGGASDKADAASDAEAPAQLRTLGITDATPARVKKFDAHFASFLKLNEKFGQTKVYKLRQSAPEKLFTLPREEFQKFGKVQCDMLESIDGMLAVFAERTPPSETIASSKASAKARSREFWETYRKVWDACCQQSKILEQNWEEWVAIGNPPDAPDKKPWQQEVDRLQGEIDAAQKRVEAFK
jgi:hypothetical protein